MIEAILLWGGRPRLYKVGKVFERLTSPDYEAAWWGPVKSRGVPMVECIFVHPYGHLVKHVKLFLSMIIAAYPDVGRSLLKQYNEADPDSLEQVSYNSCH